VYAINMIYGYKYFIPVEQPVQFSHRHHVGDDGIDCRYCHTSVEKAASAGMPSTHTCMSCHSQIWSDSPELQAVRASYTSGQPIRWNRVHDMPDFVYFNHSIHVKKGVSCETCHGRVDEKQLMFKSHTMTMSWCLDCHREPEKYIRPREAVFSMGWKLNETGGEDAPSMAIQPRNMSQTRSARIKESAGITAGSGAHSDEAHGGAAHGNEAGGAAHGNEAGGAAHGNEAGGAAHGNEAGDAAHSADSHAAGGAAKEVSQTEKINLAAQGDYSGFKTQIELGNHLKKEYNIRSARELTDCGACHR
jgi:hypothetical protein